jgi:hypothetical protein
VSFSIYLFSIPYIKTITVDKMLSNSCKNKEEEERNANLWRLIRTNKKNYKAVLDDKYLVLRTIGDGRYAK